MSGDASFPAGYWETFRSVVRATKPDALTVSETWQKDSTLLRMIRGDRLDTTMNYRLRDAVIGFTTPGAFDSKGFGDSGRIISPTELLSRLSSIREDYADAAYYTLMNLLDSHDTERLLWTLTPGEETTAGRETNAANLAEGKARLRLASLIQFTVPGAPTVYYGDEVGVTGDDDPTTGGPTRGRTSGSRPTRRSVPGTRRWPRSGTTCRRSCAATSGRSSPTMPTVSRRTGARPRVRPRSRSSTARRRRRPCRSRWPATCRTGLSLTTRLALGTGGTANATVGGGELVVTVPARGALVLATGTVDLAGPAAPTNLHVTNEADRTVSVAWNAVAGAVSYDVWTSPVTGGG